MTKKSIYLCAIDPGEHTGWAFFDEKLKLSEFGVILKEDLYDWLEYVVPSIFVVEDYKIRPASKSGWAHQWSGAFALQVIGAIQFHAHRRGIPLLLQQPSIKPVAYGWANLKPRHDDLAHAYDAVVHGIYAIRKGSIDALTSEQKDSIRPRTSPEVRLPDFSSLTPVRKIGREKT